MSHQGNCQRIVSLIASATEIVCALGFERRLVGRSHECDYPESIKNIPQCTKTKFCTDGTSYQIDQRIKAILQEGLSVYRVDVERLNKLRPDLIITQTQCEVCAVSEKDVIDAVKQMVGSHPEVVSLKPDRLDDIFDDIRLVADRLGVTNKGITLVMHLKRRINDIAEVAAASNHHPRVACIEWIEPLMAAGNWMPEMVRLAGGVNLFGASGKHSPYFSWDELRAADPDIILILPCGFDITRIQREMPALDQKEGWNELTAVRNDNVYLLDGSQYFNRPGPRIAESVEILAEIFYPERFKFGHFEHGWVHRAN